MARRSSIARLPPAVRTEVDAAINRGATIDEIVWTLKGLGADVSRSAVGRYSKQYRDLATRQREIASVAKGFAADFGQGDDMQGRLMVQLVTSLITRVAMPAVAGDEDKLPDFKELHYLARAVKDAASAAKTDQEREAKIRQQARQEAAKDAVAAARAGGASDKTIDLIWKALGVDLTKGGKG